MTAIRVDLGPATAPDELALARLRRQIEQHFGPVQHLEAHLALMDARGVRYATVAIEHWDQTNPGDFFGLVRHVIRTQATGPAPAPDVEGWLAAGRPTDQHLGEAWDLLNLSRYRQHPLPPTPRTGRPTADVARVDTLIADWEEHFASFATTYCRLEWVIEARGLTLPPISA